ncbi:MAG TPA: TIGR02587 family membrane protein [Oligoflexus sp.]|uniref:TIGR02587 family membrane protein n=1 Tax=Oligoflexus sp. TaxID=1971216 RepID=UPI002D3580D4|nr:TIGR02587 family membrane protein [Oligoflexus sp.]HYX36065.1 TIGR02587 family membrane protein [Oligoflexus sp.]
MKNGSSQDPACSPLGPNRHFLRGLARAEAGAIIFSMPLLMTMEMWTLGTSVSSWHHALLLVISLPLLVGMSHVVGFEKTFCWKDDTIDAFVALAVGFMTSAVVLLLLGLIHAEMPFSEVLNTIEVQTIPASIGALLSQSQLGGQRDQEQERSSSYGGEMFLMAVGSLFLTFSVAPTEEILLIAHQMKHWQSILLSVFSLALMHAFVYAANFRGEEEIPDGLSHWRIFLRFTVTGYALALGICLFVLWIFGRMNGLAAGEIVSVIVVLGFPAAIGASAARLII